MDWEPFWKVVEDSYRPDPIDHFEALKMRLGDLRWFEVVEFQARFEGAVAAADRADLRAAAGLINGDFSDDFRTWLVGRGRRIYEAALRDPDSLADVLDGNPVDGFALATAALRVYEQKTGMSDFYARVAGVEKDAPPDVPETAEGDFGNLDEMQKRFPKLCALYLIPADERDAAGEE